MHVPCRHTGSKSESDQSLHCPLEEAARILSVPLSAQRVFAGRTCHFVGFVTMRLKYENGRHGSVMLTSHSYPIIDQRLIVHSNIET